MRKTESDPTRRAFWWRRGCAALALLAAALPAAAAYPERPVSIVVPFAAGGGSDMVARLVAQELGEAFGQPFIVENKPGASTQIGTRQVINAEPDGHTLLLATTSVINNPHLYKNLPYDASQGLAPVVGLVDVPAFLAVGPAMEVSDVAGFLKQARTLSEANRLNYGSAGTASTLHLAGEWFNHAAKLTATHIPFKGSGPAVVALAAGEVAYSFENLGPAQGQMASKRVKLLAIAGPKRFPTLPDVPTLHEAGLPDTDLASWFVLMAPAGTPAGVIDALNRAANEALAKPRIRQRLLDQGFAPSGGTPADLAARMQADTGKWLEIIKAGNVSLDQ